MKYKLFPINTDIPCCKCLTIDHYFTTLLHNNQIYCHLPNLHNNQDVWMLSILCIILQNYGRYSSQYKLHKYTIIIQSEILKLPMILFLHASTDDASIYDSYTSDLRAIKWASWQYPNGGVHRYVSLSAQKYETKMRITHLIKEQKKQHGSRRYSIFSLLQAYS